MLRVVPHSVSISVVLVQALAAVRYPEGSVDFCMNEYSYTYSKCLRLCHDILEPSCVSDSLCVCDSEGFNNNYIKTNRTDLVDPLTTCVKTVYCDISCREQSFNQQFFLEGNLCEQASISACVCFF